MLPRKLIDRSATEMVSFYLYTTNGDEKKNHLNISELQDAVAAEHVAELVILPSTSWQAALTKLRH